MLTQAIGGLLPSAVGVALSPIPIIAVVLMLGTPKARRNGPAFALGWIAGLSAVSAAVLLLTSNASDPDSATSTGINWMQVGLGLLFLGMARRQWQKRPKRGEEPEMPTWMAEVDTIEPPKAAGLGVLLSAVNPKNLALTLAAAAQISQVGLTAGQDVVAIAIFVAIASSTTVGLVLFYLVASERAAGVLASVKDFMAAHNAVIMMVILLILGAKLLGDGLSAVSR